MADFPVDVATLGKAGTLLALAGRVRGARLPTSHVLCHGDWLRDPQAAHRSVLASGIAGCAAVRSARHDEDRRQSDAGRYRSLIGIDLRERSAFDAALRQVFASYGRPRIDDAVLLQPTIVGVRRAIVAAAASTASGGPWSLSIADGDDPAAVTAGGCAADSWYIERGASEPPADLVGPLALLRELQPLFGGIAFELELLDTVDGLWMLQARALPDDHGLPAQRRQARSRVARRWQQALCDDQPVLGLMPDWNPAELLGEHPRPLALTLFEALIARRSWWQARQSLGYARPVRTRLLRPIAGRPYVDVRSSLQSLLPAALPDARRAALVRQGLDRLRAEPLLHDHIEFELLPNACEFDLDHRFDIARDEIEAFRLVTRRALDPAAIAAELALFARPPTVRTASDRTEHAAQLQTMRRELALPFARAARRDFVGASLWRSAARRHALAPERVADLFAAAHTAAGDLLRGGGDFSLRPGQFEIGALPRRPTLEPGRAPHACEFQLRPAERRALRLLLREARLSFGPDELVQFTLASTRARELGKQALAARLNDWLERLVTLGASLGLDRDSLGWLPWPLLARADHADLPRRAEHEAARHAADALLVMPPLLHGASDLDIVRLPAQSAHWLGRGTCEAALVEVGPTTRAEQIPPGAIVAIESADPGYDWIFTRAPVALVTAFGGPHSHMALRCADVGCAAVLGIGPERFRRLVGASRLRIDLQQKRIEPTVDTPCAQRAVA